jgi:excisionase family DNA binding protein
LDKLLSVEQAAERLGTSVRFVRRLVFERRIAYVKLGRHVRIAVRDLDAFIAAGRVDVGELPSLRRGASPWRTSSGGSATAGKTTYRARYRDPTGREHAKVFARKADAQRFLTEMENSRLKGAWTNRRWAGCCSASGSRSGSGPRPGCGRTPRPGTSGSSGCTSSPTSAPYRSSASANVTCAPGWQR